MWYASDTGDHLAGDRQPAIGELFGDGFRFMSARWRALALLAVVTAAPSAVLSAIAIGRLADGVRVIDDELVGWSNDRLRPVGIMFGIVALLGAIGALATASLMLRTIDEQRAIDSATLGPTVRTTGSELSDAGHALTRSLLIMPRAFGWFGLASLVVLGVFAAMAALTIVVPLLGILLILALLPAMVFAAVRLAFVMQAVVDRPGNPFARSARVSRDRFWPTLGRMLLVGMTGWVIRSMINTPVSLTSNGGFGAGFGRTATASSFEINEDGTLGSIDFGELFAPRPLSLTLGVIVAIVAAVVVNGFVNACWGLLYRSRNPPE